uniref:uncharacterized protein LOC113475526 n=1 Tax=Ciona intestinalis TaxID=7719 RepID=UPI000EF50B57|nr:uncharacterized protein LOC113475526 [Ciona intestinalis]|eukprot:XP_026695520.1 uncharacterized protein LOC113475526 [Ciona intestinalis]
MAEILGRKKIKLSKNRHRCSKCSKSYCSKWDCEQHIGSSVRCSGGEPVLIKEGNESTTRITSFFAQASTSSVPSLSDHSKQVEEGNDVTDNRNTNAANLLLSEDFIEIFAEKILSSFNFIIKCGDDLICKTCHDVALRHPLAHPSDHTLARFTLNGRTISKTVWSIRRHLYSSFHQHCEDIVRQERDMEKKAANTKLTVGRIWLHGAQEGDSLLRSERNLCMANHITDIGDIGHSRHLARRFIVSSHEKAKERVKIWFNTKTPATNKLPLVCLNFDKLTLHRRTMLMTGGLVLFNGVITPLYLSSPVMGSDLSGADIVALVDGIVVDFGIAKNQVSAASVDGEILKKIKGHWSSKFGMSADWCGVHWDLAHGLELARKDVQPPYWLSNKNKRGVLDRIHSVSTMFKWGKRYEEGRELAEESGRKWYAPQGFCDTRWAQFEYRAVDSFLNNYTTVIEYFTDKSEETTPVRGNATSNAKNTLATLDNLTDITFVCRALLYSDFANELS